MAILENKLWVGQEVWGHAPSGKFFTLETCLDQFEGIFKHKHITESMNQPNDVEDRLLCSYNSGQNCSYLRQSNLMSWTLDDSLIRCEGE